MNTKDEYDIVVLMRDHAKIAEKTARRNALDASVEHGQAVMREMHLRNVAHVTKVAEDEAQHVRVMADRLVDQMAIKCIEAKQTNRSNAKLIDS